MDNFCKTELQEMEVCCRPVNINPLLIDDVVEAVFEYLKLPDLKRCRQVCHTWCRNASKHLSSKCKQSLLFGDGKKQFDTFLKLAQGSFYTLPHRKVTLQSSILSLNRSQSLETFFTSCGSFLHSLFITYQDESHTISYNASTTSCSNSFSSDYLFPSLSTLPVLKLFHYEELPSDVGVGDVGCGYMPTTNRRSSLPGHVLFDRLLRACKNLERLDLVLQDTDLTKTEHHFLSLVNCSRKLGTLRNLRTLMLKLPLQDYHFDLLIKAGLLNVSNIQLRFQNEQCSASSPLKFFEKFADSLKTLSTNIWMRGFSDRKKSEEELSLPCMPKLDTLEISQWRSFLGAHHHHSNLLPFQFTYQQSFPCLRKLTLQSHSWEPCWNAFFPLKEVCYTLQELKLPKLVDSNRGVLIPKIAKTFPQLRRLDVTVINSNVDILSEIFCYLSRLEELSVSFLHGGIITRNINNNNVGEGVGGRCIDYLMTGLPEAICRRIYSDDKIAHVQVDQMDTGHSLASLQYLKTLQLKNLSSVHYGTPQLQFTDITGYLALLRLKRLKTLHIWRSEMSDECISDLEQRFKLCLHPNF